MAAQEIRPRPCEIVRPARSLAALPAGQEPTAAKTSHSSDHAPSLVERAIQIRALPYSQASAGVQYELLECSPRMYPRPEMLTEEIHLALLQELQRPNSSFGI